MSTIPRHVEKLELKDPASVVSYLRGTKFACREVRQIKLGSTNFTYRLFLDAPYGHNQVRTAILKYAASHTASEPCVNFSSDRQLYEARAMTKIPWEQFEIPASDLAKQLPILSVPKLYFEDIAHHVIIMEDGTPRKGCETWDEISHSARIFLEDIPASKEKYETAIVIGHLLGSFLARLQDWGNQSMNAEITSAAFSQNSFGKELIVDETFRDFYRNLHKTTLDMNSQLKDKLGTKIADLEERLYGNLETVAMGDFWLGNVLLSFSSEHKLERLSIIDWEFMMLGPSFLDLGHFIGEIFLIHYFESNDSVYIFLLRAFIQAYRHLIKEIDIERAICYAGAHIIMALPRRITSPRSKATCSTASACAQQAVKFMTDSELGSLNKQDDSPMYKKSRDKDALEMILQIMEERRTAME
ncbi:hypothetical protein BP6252_02871 [Coleophoma cylindrospora]|uniref:Aminoglycoside phosphotransferase domain-containing protein n=1 Tax=Coleophoma cylindrospora TaxID=1849047 RepID=A0A3D8SGH2_9HELO|nr:hypothetical protein BP6252_02871 [Coleophoma cylindrospora]